MQKKRPKRRVKKTKQQEFELTPQQRRRNRVIALLILSLLILFFISRCTQKPQLKATKAKSVEKNITISNKNGDEKNITKKIKKVKKDTKSDNIDGKISIPTNKEIAKNLLLEEYRKKHSYQTALSVAEFFYSDKNYSEATKWSIVANNINNQAKKPWLLYIKCKMASKEYDKAKEAIELYMKTFKPENSKAVLHMLKKIKDREK